MAGRCLPAGLKVLLIGDSHAQALTQGWQGVPWLAGSACRAGVGTSPDVAPIVWDNAHLTRSGAELVRDTVLAPALAAAGLELAAAAR